MKPIIILHENSEWLKPITEAMHHKNLSVKEWFIDKEGIINLFEKPEKALFFNRMSPSAHTRNHLRAFEYTSAILAWLQFHQAKVINGYFPWQMENNKALQYQFLREAGILVPRTIAAFSKQDILQAAKLFSSPFLLKHNRGGKGFGVQFFASYQQLNSFLDSTLFIDSPDGITLIQEYITSPKPYVYRLEFIGKKFFYALQMDSSGRFELCPADSCSLKDTFCPITSQEKFTVLPDFPHPELIAAYENFLIIHNIDVAGIECVFDQKGTPYTYDINTNTNYNEAAEKKGGATHRHIQGSQNFSPMHEKFVTLLRQLTNLFIPKQL